MAKSMISLPSFGIKVNWKLAYVSQTRSFKLNLVSTIEFPVHVGEYLVNNKYIVDIT